MKWAWAAFAAVAVATVSPAQPKRTLRLAYLVAEIDSSLVVEFALEKFLNDSRRWILPDYDVAMDVLTFPSNSDGAAVGVVQTVTGKASYSAVLGPGSNDCVSTLNLTAKAQILQVVNCVSAELTREKYPYFFASTVSLNGDLIAWMHITASNAWTAVIGLLAEAAQIDVALRLADGRFNFTQYPILAQEGEVWIVEAWQNSAVNLVFSSRSRVVFTLLATDVIMYETVCYIHQRQVSGLQYFTIGDQQPDWYVSQPDSLYHCTLDEMYTALYGYVSTFHTSLAPGLSGYGVSFPLQNGEDHSNRALTCMPSMSVEEFVVGEELLLRGIENGDIYDDASAQIILGWAGLNADMLCAALLALHDAIYNKGIDLAEIEQHSEAGYEELLLSMASVHFQGGTGEYFYPAGSGNTGDVNYIFFQRALPNASNVTVQFHAVFNYPHGQGQAPVFDFLQDGDDFRWRDGSLGLGPNPQLGLFPICRDSNSELVGEICRPCAPGKAFDALLDACRTCQPGSYQNESAQSGCIAARPGWYINNTDEPSEVLACPSGHECPQTGTVTPLLCAPGRYAMDSGREACALCPIGRYQSFSGASSCADCEEIITWSTTKNIASTSSAACICSGTLFLPLGATECVGCPDGMNCPEGSDMRNLGTSGPYPLASEGYMTRVADYLRVFKCAAEEHCPGGPPATCAELRDPSAVACGSCVRDAYQTNDECKNCGEASAWPLVIFCTAAIGVTAVAAVLINRDMGKTASASVMIVVMTGILFTSLQAMGVFHQLSIPWAEPVKSLLRVSHIFSFEVKELRFSCVVGSSPVRSFALRQAAPLVVIPIVATTIAVKKYACCCKNSVTHARLEATNAVGAIYTLFFISILLSALSPFLCYKHPNSNGESVLSDPSLLCFESTEHINMVIISCLSIVAVPLPLAAACVFGVFMYQTYIAKSDASRFFLAFRFLFFKYTPQRYYFQCIFLARSLCLCLIPAILRGQPATQLLFVCLLLAVYVAVVSEQQPWQNKLSNKLDASMNVMLLIMLMCGALFLEDVPQRGAVSFLAMSAAVVVLAMGCLGLAIGVWSRLMPHPFYDYFLCHHKAHAAAQTRYLKIVMQETRRSCRVFIDSDDLKELDTLFDTVKTRVGHLVVYLTADTLKRPWCVGEIVSATRVSLVITRVKTPMFVAPSEEQISEPQSYVDSAGCNLSEYHIEWGDVTQAFHWLLHDSKEVRLPITYLGRAPIKLLAGELLSVHASQTRQPTLKDVSYASVVLSNDANNCEACAAGGILMARLSRHIYQVFEHGDCVLSDYDGDIPNLRRMTKQASAVVVILSEGCLMSVPVVTVICELEYLLDESLANLVPVSVNIPGFAFPTPAAIDEARANASGLATVYGNAMSGLLNSFFKNISILLPTHASQEALDIQAEEILNRISRITSAKNRRGSTISTSSDSSTTTTHRQIARKSAPANCGAVSDFNDDDVTANDWQYQAV